MSIVYMKELLSLRLRESAALIDELGKSGFEDPELSGVMPGLRDTAIAVSDKIRVCKPEEEEGGK